MAKIRIARKSDIYAALSVFTTIFLVIGLFFVGYKLKTSYGEDVGKQQPPRSITPAPAGPDADDAAGDAAADDAAADDAAADDAAGDAVDEPAPDAE